MNLSRSPINLCKSGLDADVLLVPSIVVVLESFTSGKYLAGISSMLAEFPWITLEEPP